MTYYNDNDPGCVTWLLNLIEAGALPSGVVDARDIREVTPHDLDGFTQCHFFAGIGGWPLALTLAGWPADCKVWTGSCPCQPFSKIGQSRGTADARHLWPAWYRLIAQCHPPVVFGEQVARGAGWLTAVLRDLQAADFAVATVALPAASVGAPHLRQRYWFVGESERAGLEGLAGDGDATARREEPGGSTAATGTASPWADADWLACADDRYRPVEPGTQPLAHGIPARVGRLRGYGDAIVPQVGAVFVRAYLDAARSLRSPSA